MKQIPARIQHRSQTAETWRAINPILEKGEMGIEEDTRKFKFGNGSTAWNDLSYATGVESIPEEVRLQLDALQEEGIILSLDSNGILRVPHLIFTDTAGSMRAPLSMNAEGFSLTQNKNCAWVSAGNIGVTSSRDTTTNKNDSQWNLNGRGVICTGNGVERAVLENNGLKFKSSLPSSLPVYTSYTENGIKIPVSAPGDSYDFTTLDGSGLLINSGDTTTKYGAYNITSAMGRTIPLDQIALLSQLGGGGKIKFAWIGKNGTFEIKPNMIALIMPWDGSTFYHGDPSNGGTDLGLSSATTSFVIASGRVDSESYMNEEGDYFRAAIVYATTLSVKSNQNMYSVDKGLWFKNAHNKTSGSGNAYIFYIE